MEYSLNFFILNPCRLNSWTLWWIYSWRIQEKIIRYSICWCKDILNVIIVCKCLKDLIGIWIFLSVQIRLRQWFDFISFLLLIVIHRDEGTFNITRYFFGLRLCLWWCYLSWRWLEFFGCSVLVCLCNISCSTFSVFILSRRLTLLVLLCLVFKASAVVKWILFCHCLCISWFSFFKFLSFLLVFIPRLHVRTRPCLNDCLWGFLVKLSGNHFGLYEFCTEWLNIFGHIICPCWMISISINIELYIRSLSLNRK